MIGDLLLLFGIPSIPAGLIWLAQKISGRQSPSGTYFRRRVYGFVFLLMLLSIILGMVVLIGAISNSPNGSAGASVLGRNIGKFIFIELPLVYWWGIKTEDGFLRAVFISYSSLTPQAKERLISGRNAASSQSIK